MTIDRRTFLAHGMRTSATFVVAASLPAGMSRPAGAEERAVGRGLDGLRPSALTVNGVVDPVGVDPDDCAFAWKLQGPGRKATQGAYRITVRRVDPHRPGTVWDSGPVASARQAFLGYDGPPLPADAAYEWTVVVRDDGGRWSAPGPTGRFTTALRPGDWAAQWLHPAASSPQPNRVTYVRTELSPPVGVIRRATAFVAAAHTYRLYINGAERDFGPSFSYPDEQYYRAVDITAALNSGRSNAVGVLHHWYGPGQGRPASSPGLLVQVSLWYADGRQVTYGSDGTWREREAEWLPSPLRNTDGADFVEWVDGRAHPSGWADPGFDDSTWTPVAVIGPAPAAPFLRTFVQRTDIAEQVVEPVSLRTLANGSLVADFGKIYAARPRVTFARGVDGRTVAMHAGYLLDPDGAVSTTHGTQETNLSFSYITRAGAQTFEALTYLGFRYLQIDDPGAHLDRHQIVAITQHVAMPDVPMATFSTDVRMLNAVWQLTARSCLYCTHEQFVDTPTREKGQFVWDAANESEGVMGAYGEQNLSWQGLRDVARGQARYHPDGRVNAVYPNGDGARDFPTFTERYPEWLWRYYVATGDLTTAHALYPSTARVAEYLWSTRDERTGLLFGLADGDDGDPIFDYDLAVVADTASNVLGINAFTRIAQLAALAGDDAGALTQQSRATQLTTAVNSTLIAPDGVYVDGIEVDGSPSRHRSQEANALALAYGVVPAANLAVVGAYVAGLQVAVGPNHGLELLRGLVTAGRWDDLVKTLTDPTAIGWAHIVASGGTFTWETWTPSDLIGDSLSHGWGSSALVAMQESILGINLLPPTPDGTVHAAINPPPSGLDRARGSIPTIAGPLAVSWSRGPRRFNLEATVPANARATITIPATTRSSIFEGGIPITRSVDVTIQQVGDGRAILGVGSGSYRFTTT
jgi:alpha-L-rhamnosidase